MISSTVSGQIAGGEVFGRRDRRSQAHRRCPGCLETPVLDVLNLDATPSAPDLLKRRLSSMNPTAVLLRDGALALLDADGVAAARRPVCDLPGADPERPRTRRTAGPGHDLRPVTSRRLTACAPGRCLWPL
jgi:hypothetical protein